MDIAFYAPLKSPDHPVPSGDRLMARALLAALRQAGHRVEVSSQLRAYSGTPDDGAGWAALRAAADREIDRLSRLWTGTGAPHLWFCYHPYYKAPDLLGPQLCARFGLPCVTAESSYSARRNVGLWAEMQDLVLQGARQAAVNIALTARDAAGLAAAAPLAPLARLRPFLDLSPGTPTPEAGHLVTVAMMRPGDKAESYARLAAALRRIVHLPWQLSIAGDGAARPGVEAMFAGLPQGRVRFLGLLPPDAVQALLLRGGVYVWPGYGEAYGLAYLEAQAAGLPVVACAVAGVPEVVRDGVTGILVPAGDDAAFADAVAGLLADEPRRRVLAAAARETVLRDHGMAAASSALDLILAEHLGGKHGP